MKKIFIIVLLALVGQQAFAQSEIPDGVFFKVEGKGLKKPCYLLGSVHYINGEYRHKIEGYDSLLNTIGCLATELKMDYVLHPELVSNSSLNLTHEDSVNANTLLPVVCADFADTSKADAYTRYLTPQQLDTLDNMMDGLKFDVFAKVLAMQMPNLQFDASGTNLYRRMNPLVLCSLLPSILANLEAVYNIQKGYGQNDDQFDICVMKDVYNINQKAKSENAGNDKIQMVGLDSIYARNELSASFNISELLKNMSTEKMVKFIYKKVPNIYNTYCLLDPVEKLYTEGKGKETVNTLASAEPEAYANKVIIEGRNKYWMTQLPALFKEKQTLVVVGLGHLLPTTSSKGLISMLQEQGYKVSKIK